MALRREAMDSTLITHKTGNTPIKLLFTIADSETRKPVEKEFKKYTKTQKDSQGKEKRYLCGVMSGLAVDAHGERMSEKAIQGMIEQTHAKDITLYTNHGKDFTEDIGILRNIIKLDNGDLYAEFELYDDNSEADKVWAQANGLPPYKHARQFGFSIEGFVPEDKIRNTATGKEIDYVDLDPGVSLVSKPAYTPSIVQAIQKAFNTHKSGNVFESIISSRKRKKDFYNTLEEIDDIMEVAEDKILSSQDSPETKESLLRNAYESYIDRKIELYKQLDFNIPYMTEENPQSGLPKTSESQGSDSKVQQNQTTKENDMSEEMKGTLAEIMAMLQSLVQVEQATGETLEASEGATIEEAKSVLAKSKEHSKKKSKLMGKLLSKAEKLLKEAEELEEAEKAVEEEEEIKQLLKDVDSPEEEGGSDDNGIINAEEEVEELDSELQEQILEKAFGFDKNFAKTILSLSRKKSTGNKHQIKKSSSKLLAQELANTKKELRILKQAILGSGQAQTSGSVQVKKGYNANIGQEYTVEDIKKAQGQMQKLNGEGTIRDNAELVLKSIFGGR
jgi:hypothetical protein